MKSFLTATAIMLALGSAPTMAQSTGTSSNSTSSGGEYTGGGIAGTSNGGGTAGTAATTQNSQQNSDYDSTASDRRNSPNKGASSGTTTRDVSQGPNGTPYPPDTRNNSGPSDRGSTMQRPTTPP